MQEGDVNSQDYLKFMQVGVFNTFTKKASEPNNVFVHFEEFPSLHNSERSSNATQLNLLDIIVIKILLNPDPAQPLGIQ